MPPRVSLLRLQATTACNLNCTYCYIPAAVRRRRDTMPAGILDTTLRRLVEEDLLGDDLAISWHGAEPLAAGLGWYEDAAGRVAAALAGVRVQHVFQTNGVLIDDAWCRFFKDSGATVGVSVDGPATTNTARVNWAGRSAHQATMRGVAKLNEHGIPWTLLAVVTADVMADPEGFVDFARSAGCSGLGFKVEETNVANVSRLDAVAGIERRYAEFVRTVAGAFPLDGPVRVRELERFRLLAGFGNTRQARPATVVPLRNLTVAASGDFTVFSGELLFGGDSRFSFGNVLDGPFLSCLTTEKFRRVSGEILRGVGRCASECEFYGVCGAFYLSQKHAEHGTFDATETLACRLEIKTLFRTLAAAGASG